MQRFLQLLRESNTQNAFQVLYNLYLTINRANADEIIAFWHTIRTFKLDVKQEDYRKKISKFEYALIQRMKELAAAQENVLSFKLGQARPLTLRQRFEHTVGGKLNEWK